MKRLWFVCFLFLLMTCPALADDISISATGIVTVGAFTGTAPSNLVPVLPGNPFSVLIDLQSGFTGGTVSWTYNGLTGCFPVGDPTCTFTVPLRNIQITNDNLFFVAFNRPGTGFGLMDVGFTYPAGSFGMNCDQISICSPAQLAATLSRVNLLSQTGGVLAIDEQSGLPPDFSPELFGVIDRNSVTVTPEPSSLVLLGSGLVGFFIYRRRKMN